MPEMWSHQRDGLDFLAAHPRAMLAWEMGAGKSRVVVEHVCSTRPATTLILAPKSVVPVWPAEFVKHRPDVKIVIEAPVKGSVTERTRAILLEAKIAKLEGRPFVAVINYDVLAHLSETNSRCLQYGPHGGGWDLVVCDEVHRLKSPSGVQSRFASRIKSTNKVGLTGTLMPHSPMDVYGPFRFLDPDVFGWSWTAFRAHYARLGGYKVNGRPVQIIGFQNLDDLKRRIATRSHFVRLDDVLDVPIATHQCRVIPAEAMGAGLTAYERLEDHLVADVRGGTVTPSNALVRFLRLQQATSGEVTDDAGVSRHVHDAKAAGLAEVLEDVDPARAVVVFCRFSPEIAAVRIVASGAGRPAMELSGQANALADWQDAARRGTGPVLACQIQSGGVGVDMSMASTCVFWTQPLSLGVHDQAVSRLRRPGQTRTVTCVHLVIAGTVDEKIRAALDARRDVIETLIASMREAQHGDDDRGNGAGLCAVDEARA